MRKPNYFVAVPLPDSVKSELGEKCERMRQNYLYRKWVDARDYHITVKFFGDCSPGQLHLIRQQLTETVANAVPFTLFLQGAGCFGRNDSPRIFWAGVTGELEALNQLQAAVDKAMAEIGFPPESRAYHPHVTLARQYQGAEVPFDEQAGAWGTDWTGEAWTVRSLVLYKTEFGITPMYKPVQEFVFPAK